LGVKFILLIFLGKVVAIAPDAKPRTLPFWISASTDDKDLAILKTYFDCEYLQILRKRK
jgi:hypothetical protein